MTMTMNSPRAQLLGALALTVAVAAAFWIAEGAGAGLIAGAWLLAFVALLHFGRDRFDAIDVMVGAGDERSRTLYTRTAAFAGTVVTYVVIAWWLVTLVQGDPNQTLTAVVSIAGVAFIVGAIINSRRG